MKECLVKIVQIDDLGNVNIPIPVVIEGETVEIFPVENEVGAPVYELPKSEARRLLAARPNRYKLYQTAPLQIFVRQPDQSTAPKWFFPWSFRKLSKEKLGPDGQPMRDPDNGEYVFTDYVEWYEDLEGKSVVKSADAPPSGDHAAMNAQIEELARKFGDLKTENEEQEKRIAHLTRAMSQKDAEIAALKAPVKKSKVSTSIAD